MKHIIAAVHHAAKSTESAVTSEAQSHVHAHGWSPEATNAVKAEYKDGEFSVAVKGKHRDAAFIHEFGDEEHPPTAALRKYSRNSPKAEQAFISNLETHLKGML